MSFMLLLVGILFVLGPFCGIVYNPLLFLTLIVVLYISLRALSLHRLLAAGFTYVIVGTAGVFFAWRAAGTMEPSGTGWTIRTDLSCQQDALPITTRSKPIEKLVRQWHSTRYPGERLRIEKILAGFGKDALPYLSSFPCREELHAWVPSHEFIYPFRILHCYAGISDGIYFIKDPAAESDLRRLLVTRYKAAAAEALLNIKSILDPKLFEVISGNEDLVARPEFNQALQNSDKGMQISACNFLLANPHNLLIIAEYRVNSDLSLELDKFLRTAASTGDPSVKQHLQNLAVQIQQDLNEQNPAKRLDIMSTSNAKHVLDTLDEILKGNEVLAK